MRLPSRPSQRYYLGKAIDDQQRVTRDGQTTFCTEEQLELLGDSAVDCGIDVGDYLLIEPPR